MKDRRGFTLIELLAVLVVLGIIMLIAVPNVLSTMDNNKKEIYITDAGKMVTMAEYAIRSNTDIALPNPNEILILPLSTINNGDLEEDPEGRAYSLTDSYVAIMKNNGFDEYWVNLVGEEGTRNRGIRLTKYDDLKGSDRLNRVVLDMNILKTSNTGGIAQTMCGTTNCRTVRIYVSE